MGIFKDDSLSHAGVKGMRWGFRKKPSGGYAPSGRTPARSGQPTNVKKLSDKQLDQKITRLKKEKEFQSLTTPLKGPKVINGKKLAGDILEGSARQVGTAVLTAAALYGAKKFVEKKFGVDVKAEMFPRKK